MQHGPTEPNPYAAPNAPIAPIASASGPAPLRLEGAFGRAFDVVKQFLFRPFDFGKWFVFGFIVFLEELGGSNPRISIPNFSNPLGPPGFFPDPRPIVEHAVAWMRDNAGLLVVIVVAGALLGVALSAVLMWLAARGAMMAFRAVAHNHAGLGDHWQATTGAAWSYFGFRALCAAITAPFSLGLVCWMVIIAYRAMEAGASDFMDYLRRLAAPAILFLVFSLVALVIQFLGRNILAPILLVTGGGLRDGWARTMAVVKTSLGPLILFAVLRMIIGVVQALGELILIYLTCCLGALPVIHQMVSAPFHVFERAYTLFVLESLGPEYRLVLAQAPVEPFYPPPPYYYQGGGPPR